VGLTRENPVVVDLRIPVDGFMDARADASVERGSGEPTRGQWL